MTVEGQWSTTNQISGDNDALWLVHDGRQQWGPYSTEQMIQMLYAKQVDWLWSIWRQGMEKWLAVGQLFTNHEIDGQPIRLRDFNYITVPKQSRKKRGRSVP